MNHAPLLPSLASTFLLRCILPTSVKVSGNLFAFRKAFYHFLHFTHGLPTIQKYGILQLPLKPFSPLHSPFFNIQNLSLSVSSSTTMFRTHNKHFGIIILSSLPLSARSNFKITIAALESYCTEGRGHSISVGHFVDTVLHILLCPSMVGVDAAINNLFQNVVVLFCAKLPGSPCCFAEAGYLSSSSSKTILIGLLESEEGLLAPAIVIDPPKNCLCNKVLPLSLVLGSPISLFKLECHESYVRSESYSSFQPYLK